MISGTITGLAFGGEGILRHDELVVFVPFTAIGDRITCKIVKQKKSYAFAELVEILEPSSDRNKPACPYFGTCGGCQLQHLKYQTQLNYKKQCVEDGLQRIGGMPINLPQTIPSKAQWAYRRRIALTLRPNGKGSFSTGYIAHDGSSLLEIDHCPIFTKADDPIISQVSACARNLNAASSSEGKVMILKHEITGKYLISFHFEAIPHNGKEVIEHFMGTYQSWAGVRLNAPGFKQVYGTATSTLHLEGLTFRYSPEAFIQNHPEQSAAIYRTLRQIARQSPCQTILDLYCGIGITSILIAQEGKRVIGVESNGNAVQLAFQNAQINNVKTASFLKGDVKKTLPKLLKKHPDAQVIINPPRQGMEKDVVIMILEQPPSEVVYISCMPSTLARDIKDLKRVYEIREIQSYDMFPQTAHVETLVYLEKRKG